MDEEVQKILTQAHEKVMRVLSSQGARLEEIARLLLEKEVVERPELVGLLNRRKFDETKAKGPVEISRIEKFAKEKEQG